MVSSAWKWTVDLCIERELSARISHEWWPKASQGGPYHIHQGVQQSGNWGGG